MRYKQGRVENKVVITDSFKKYRYDQDKNIHPAETITVVTSKIREKFKNDNMMLQRMSPENYPVSAYRFVNSYYSSNGKGVCSEQAKASAIMEFVERYCWIYFDYLSHPGLMHGTCKEVSRCGDVIKEGYFACSVADVTKEVLDEITDEVSMSWIPGYSLVYDKSEYYPINWHNMTFSSSGLCSGNSNEEAIFQGMCELIERHNFDYFMNTKTPVCEIRLNDVDDDILDSILEQCIKDDIELHCYNITYKFGVPTFAVCGKDLDTPYFCLKEGWGLGTHTSPIKAIYRAVTEYFMGRFMIMRDIGGAEEQYKKLKNENLGFNIRLRMDDVNVLTAGTLGAVNDLSDDNIRVEINRILDVMKAFNIDLLVVNKTNKDLDVPVFRVVSDGLTHRSLKISATKSVHFNLAQMYVEAGDRKKAEEHFLRAVANATSLSSYFNIEIKKGAMEYLFRKDYKEAINALFLNK